MASKYERKDEDGEFSVERTADGRVFVSVTHDGVRQSATMSEFNAARLFGGLALVLGVELPKKVWNQL